jgi:hypothetical protein
VREKLESQETYLSSGRSMRGKWEAFPLTNVENDIASFKNIGLGDRWRSKSKFYHI